LYAHFRGRDAILEALADEVREELGEALKFGGSKGAMPVDRLVNIGCAYVEFALARPAEFELLFRWTRSRRGSRADRRPSPLDLLKTVAREVRPEASEDEIDLCCLGLWSAAHGLASLRTTHLASFPGDWHAWDEKVLRAQVEGALCVSR
jgi:AcrR family transcriptional regulator